MAESDLTQVLKAGTLLVIITGEYSDTNWEGPVRVLKDVTKQVLVDQFQAEWKPPNDWDEAPRPEHFLPWLVQSGWVEAIENVNEWHVGGYGDFEP